MSTEEDVLFGVVSVQLGLVSSEQLDAATSTDTAETLADRLVAARAITPETREMIARMVETAIASNDNNPHQTLTAMGGAKAIQRVSVHLSAFQPESAELDETATMEPAEQEEDLRAVTSEHSGRYQYQDAELGRSTGSSELGRGGLGRVLLALDQHIGREVAIKEILPEKLANNAARSPGATTPINLVRFLREARVTGQLEHPNIVPVYELGRRADGSLYYTMKVVRGRTLKKALRECGSYAQRVGYLPHFVDLCHAIAYAHSRGVLHRDIKPDNVMVGEFGETVVLDWGLAKVRGKNDLRGEEIDREIRILRNNSAGLTSAGSLLGTPLYMSPEQAAGGLQNIDEASDIWSLGALLYHLLTGQTPFSGKMVFEVLTKIITKDVCPVREVCAEVPAELASICEKTLRKEKSQRYLSAGELADDVTAYLTGGKVKAYEYPTWELLKRFARRYRLPLTVTCIALTLLVLLGAITHLRVVAERNRALEAESEARLAEAAATEAERDERKRRAEALRESARNAMLRGSPLEARVKLRTAFETEDGLLARAIWWQLEENPLLWVQPIGSTLYQVVFAPDGQSVAVATQSGAIYLLDVSTKNARVLRVLNDDVIALAFSPDGTHLASGSWSGRIRLWDLGTGEYEFVGSHTLGIMALDFSPDGRLLASRGNDNTIVLWNVTEGTQQQVIDCGSGMLFSLDFSPDGRLLASSNFGGTIRLWDVQTGRLKRELVGHTADVLGVAFSPDGNRLASAGLVDQTVRLWDVESGDTLWVLRGHSAGVNFVAFNHDGTLVASSGDDQSIILWDTRSGDMLSVLADFEDAAMSIAFSPDGRQIVAASEDDTVQLFNIDAAKQLKFLAGHTTGVSGIDFSPDGTTLVSGGYDSTVRLWDVATGEELAQLEHDGAVNDVAFDPDGDYVASGGAGKIITIWDVEAQQEHGIIAVPKDGITTFAFSPAGGVLASAGGDLPIRLWDFETGEQLRVLTGFSAYVLCIAFNPDGTVLASGHNDGTIRLWDVETGRQLRGLQGHASDVYDVIFSPDGSALASCSDDRTVRIWNTETGESRLIGQHDYAIHDIDYHPDGNHLVSLYETGTVRIWDLRTLEFIELRGHQNEVSQVLFDPSGRLVATAGSDGTIRLWESGTGNPFWRAPVMLHTPLMLLTHNGWLDLVEDQVVAEVDKQWQKEAQRVARFASQSDDGARLCMASLSHTLQLWDIQADTMLFEEPIEDLRQVLATADGCLARDGEVVSLYDAEGQASLLADSVYFMSRAGDDFFIVTEQQLRVFDARGNELGVFAIGTGVTAATRAQGWLVLGFKEGNIELLPYVPGGSRDGQRKSSFIFESIPACPVVSMLEGPKDTLLVGYSNGVVGIWSLQNGALLNYELLHGPVNHMLLRNGKLHAATDLGSHMIWDLSVFYKDYCELLHDVWREVPLEWRDGLSVPLPPPAEHPCFETLPATR